MTKSLLLMLLLMLQVWTSSSVVFSSQTTTFDEERFNNVVAKMESTVLELAREVERLYATRCDEATIASCEAANYENCLSQFPNPQCLVGPNFKVDACGDGELCSSQWDFTTSSTRIPANLANGVNGNPTDPKLIETLCFTRPLDAWFVQKRNEDLPFWQSLGIESPPSMYFGSNNGGFRIFPARHTDNCGAYDPRTRPWYVAASSGPKNIILILDVSGSIDEVRLHLLKEAAKRVVETLTVHDRITIIPFATNATKIIDSNGHMFRATAENIALLSQQIDTLVAGGRTNFYDAFQAAFDVFDATIDEEVHASCNSAILFFTDGERTDGPDTEAVTQLVQDRLATIQARLFHRPILLFTYSISQEELVHQYPSQLACAVEKGVWSKISNDDEIIESLSSYYQLFALGLGSDANEDFVAWVEPYDFFSGLLGTTVSVPVYDRTKSPPLFLGVVAVDIPIAAIDAALGGTDHQDSAQVRAESIRRVVSSSRVICPLLDLDECELESYRRGSMYDGSASCLWNCSADQLVQVEEEECPGRPDYPSNYWANVDVADSDYANRTCCRIQNDMSESSKCAGPFLSHPHLSTSPPNQTSTVSPNTDPSPTNDSTTSPPLIPHSRPTAAFRTTTVPVIAGSAAGGVIGLFLAAMTMYAYCTGRITFHHCCNPTTTTTTTTSSHYNESKQAVTSVGTRDHIAEERPAGSVEWGAAPIIMPPPRNPAYSRSDV